MFHLLQEAIHVGFTSVIYRRPWVAAHPDYAWVSNEYERLTRFYRDQGGSLIRLIGDGGDESIEAEVGAPPTA